MFVYVMTSGNRCTIGISKAPRRRRSHLTTSNPDGVQLMHCIQVGPDALAIEKRAHAILKDFACSREWFRVHPLVAVSVLDHVIEGEPTAELIEKLLLWAKMDNIPSGSRRYDIKQHIRLEDELREEWSFGKEVMFRL